MDAAKALVQALHGFGFTKIVGHGLSLEEINEALAWAKKLFKLPYEEKLKAPHPPESMPHRGYSAIGKEKVYDFGNEDGREQRKISDFKVGRLDRHFKIFTDC